MKEHERVKALTDNHIILCHNFMLDMLMTH